MTIHMCVCVCMYYLNIFDGFGFIAIIVIKTQTVPSLASENFFRLAPWVPVFYMTLAFDGSLATWYYRVSQDHLICFLFLNLESDISSETLVSFGEKCLKTKTWMLRILHLSWSVFRGFVVDRARKQTPHTHTHIHPHTHIHTHVYSDTSNSRLQMYYWTSFLLH